MLAQDEKGVGSGIHEETVERSRMGDLPAQALLQDRPLPPEPALQRQLQHQLDAWRRNRARAADRAVPEILHYADPRGRLCYGTAMVEE